MKEGMDNVSAEFDKIQKFDNGTVIQHGTYNDRIFLMKKGDVSSSVLIDQLKQMADQNCYSKIFAKSSLHDLPVFIDRGFTVEAIVPGYFNGIHDLFMVCHYLKRERGTESDPGKYESILHLAKSKASAVSSHKKDVADVIIRNCRSDDVSQMASIYRQIFASYPFPIYDPNYLQQNMNNNVDYYCVEKNDRILALSAAEIDYASQSAEMTDFATQPEARGNGFAANLLSVMEKETALKGINTFYTIARAISPGMNITFARHGYTFGGRLKNNTNISGDLESMNVWYKCM